MLSSAYFYYQTTRQMVTLFGNIFNDITIKRRNTSTGREIERFKVPISYGPADKFLAKFDVDPNLDQPIQVILPRMSFEISSIRYDANRKQISLLRTAATNNATTGKSTYMAVPYDIGFTLHIYAKTSDDATHVVEQILPYFTPDYNVTIDAIADIGFHKDIPIILHDVKQNISYESDFETARIVMWELNFTMKTYYYGPKSEPKIIRKVITNIYNDPSLVRGYITKMYLSGNGTFNIEDVVYQGSSYDTATAYGVVNEWRDTDNKLILAGVQGNFTVGSNVHAVTSNASYTISSFDVTPIKLAQIVIEPDPIDASPDSAYGYDTTITEWPDTEV